MQLALSNETQSLLHQSRAWELTETRVAILDLDIITLLWLWTIDYLFTASATFLHLSLFEKKFSYSYSYMLINFLSFERAGVIKGPVPWWSVLPHSHAFLHAKIRLSSALWSDTIEWSRSLHRPPPCHFVWIAGFYGFIYNNSRMLSNKNSTMNQSMHIHTHTYKHTRIPKSNQ